MLFRTATSDDLPKIIALSSTTPWEKSNLLRRAVVAGDVVVAVEKDVVTGFIVWNFRFFEKPFVWLVVVAHERRRKGVASGLFADIEGRCANRPLHTSTNESNAAMIAFLHSRGYSRIGTLDLDPGDPEIFFRRNVG